jgi:hypothetical protein
MKSFSKWLDEDVVGKVLHKISSAARTAVWAVRHPVQVPSEIHHMFMEEWRNLVEKYGTTEAILILSSLVISLGPGLVVPGSIALVWITIGACKLFNTVVKTVSHEKPKLTEEQINNEAARLRKRLLKKAEYVQSN